MCVSTKLLICIFLGGLLLPLVHCGGAHSAGEKYYLVAANIRIPYWQSAGAGLIRAARDLKVNAELVGPETYEARAQQREFQRVVKLNPAGILVSPVDPGLMAPDIDAAINAGIPVITMDSDSPLSKRLLFIGTNNYEAGVMGGRLTAKLLQNRGNVVVFTMPGQANLDERLNGYRFAFADSPRIKIEQVVDIRGNPRIAFDATADILEKRKDTVDAFVCLEALAGKEVAEVVNRSGAAHKTIVAMDTDQGTLEWIQKGVIAATVAQKPFTMGFHGLKLLDDLHHHPLSRLSANWAEDPFSRIPRLVDTGVTLIDKSTVAFFIKARDTETSGANP